MNITRGRILRVESPDATTIPGEPPGRDDDAQSERLGIRRGRILRAELLDAQNAARALLADAQRQATKLVADAQRDADEQRAAAEREGREAGAALFSAKLIELAQIEARSDERSLDRTVALARLLAERLLGDELRLQPERVTALSKAALTELRAARQITIVCHPSDAPHLRDALHLLSVAEQSLDVRPDDARAVGSLRLETELGVLDGELAPRLDRLVQELSEELRR